MHDPAHPNDHKTMYQVITSPIVAAPAAHFILKLLHNNKAHYVPLNGHKSSPTEVSDTKEDMMEVFHTDASGAPRELKKLMGRRNYIACVPFDAAAAAGGAGVAGVAGAGVAGIAGAGGAVGGAPGYAASIASGGSGSAGGASNGGGLTKLSLAIDFVVQGDGAFTTPTKYGPVIVPHLEFGR